MPSLYLQKLCWTSSLMAFAKCSWRVIFLTFLSSPFLKWSVVIHHFLDILHIRALSWCSLSTLLSSPLPLSVYPTFEKCVLAGLFGLSWGEERLNERKAQKMRSSVIYLRLRRWTAKVSYNWWLIEKACVIIHFNLENGLLNITKDSHKSELRKFFCNAI